MPYHTEDTALWVKGKNVLLSELVGPSNLINGPALDWSSGTFAVQSLANDHIPDRVEWFEGSTDGGFAAMAMFSQQAGEADGTAPIPGNGGPIPDQPVLSWSGNVRMTTDLVVVSHGPGANGVSWSMGMLATVRVRFNEAGDLPLVGNADEETVFGYYVPFRIAPSFQEAVLEMNQPSLRLGWPPPLAVGEQATPGNPQWPLLKHW